MILNNSNVMILDNNLTEAIRIIFTNYFPFEFAEYTPIYISLISSYLTFVTSTVEVLCLCFPKPIMIVSQKYRSVLAEVKRNDFKI